MRIQPAQRLPVYQPGWGGPKPLRVTRGMLGLGQTCACTGDTGSPCILSGGACIDSESGDPCDCSPTTAPVTTPVTTTPAAPAPSTSVSNFAPGSCWDSSLNPVACGPGASYVVASDGSLTSYTGGATPAGGGLTTAQLTALTNTIAAGGQTAINISKALSTPSLVAGTGVVYNPATGQFYNPQTGQVVSPSTTGAGTGAAAAGVTISPTLILLFGGLLVLMVAMGGRR